MSIGGYFELEIPYNEEYYNDDQVIRLNTGRNAFEYLLIANEYKKVFLPYYTCSSILEPMNRLSLEYEFYHIDKSLTPIFDFEKIKGNEVVVVNNYFGLCDKQVAALSKKTRNIIIDNSQAFYSKPLSDIDTFYSPRKFFGLPDGGYIYSNKKIASTFEKDISYKRVEHLVGRIDTTAEEHFKTSKTNGALLSNQPIKEMSNLTQRLLSGIEYDNIAETRRSNFSILHTAFKSINEIDIAFSEDAVPLIYPLLLTNGINIKKKLIENKIYVATYWSNVLNWSDKTSFEYHLTENLLALPIDQRYGEKEMKLIIEIINEYIS